MNLISRWWLDLRIARAEARLSAIRMRPHYTAELNEAFLVAARLRLQRGGLSEPARRALEAVVGNG